MNPFLENKGLAKIDSTETISKLCKRPELSIKEVIGQLEKDINPLVDILLQNEKALEQVEIELKYEGYIKRQYEMVDRMEKYESAKIPLTLNYANIKALSTEGREKLNKVKPRSIGQASRISGVTPSDISILLVCAHLDSGQNWRTKMQVSSEDLLSVAIEIRELLRLLAEPAIAQRDESFAQVCVRLPERANQSERPSSRWMAREARKKSVMLLV